MIARVAPGLVWLTRQRHDDDDVALEPHADVHEDRYDEQRGDVRPDLLEPQEQRQEPVADIHRPRRPPKLAERAVVERGPLVGIPTIPGDKVLCEVRKPDDR